MFLWFQFVDNMLQLGTRHLSPGARHESSETFCILKAKAFQVTKLCGYFNFSSLYIMWKGQLYRTSGSEFYEWLFGPEKFTGLSRNGPQILTAK